MKKMISLLIALLLMLVSVFGVSADASLSDEEQVIYDAFIRLMYDKYAEERADDEVWTYEEFAASYPVDDLFVFEYCGEFGEDQIPIAILSTVHAWGTLSIPVGDYVLDIGCIINDPLTESPTSGGVYAYDEGKLVYLPEAYERGIVDDAILAEVCAGHFSAGCADRMMRRIGDMDGNERIDVADMILLKEKILSIRYDYTDEANRAFWRNVADYNDDGYVDVADILSMKNDIMSK